MFNGYELYIFVIIRSGKVAIVRSSEFCRQSFLSLVSRQSLSRLSFGPRKRFLFQATRSSLGHIIICCLVSLHTQYQSEGSLLLSPVGVSVRNSARHLLPNPLSSSHTHTCHKCTTISASRYKLYDYV